MKLKVEINTREHETKLELISVPYSVETRWFSGSADITTYRIEELIGTKIRALYQRKKGRDLFDLWYAQENCKIDWKEAVACFRFYTQHQGVSVSATDFQQNIEKKLADKGFVSDIRAIKRPDITPPEGAYLQVAELLRLF